MSNPNLKQPRFFILALTRGPSLGVNQFRVNTSMSLQANLELGEDKVPMRIAMAPNNAVMSSSSPRQSSRGIKPELEIAVGDIQYILIPNEEVVLYC